MNRKLPRFIFLIAAGLFTLALLFILTQPSQAAQIVVDENGEGNYTKLNSAAQVAQEGDVILVRAGEYDLGTSLSFRDNVTVRGEGAGRTRLVFDLPTGSSYFMGRRLSLQNLNFTSPWPENSNIIWFYPGFEEFSISNCSFEELGGGVYIYIPPEGFAFSNNSFWNTRFQPYYLDSYETPANATTEGNSVDGKPLDFLVNQQDVTLGPGSAGAFLVNCSNIRITGATFGEESLGVRVARSRNILVEDSQFTAGAWDQLRVSSSEDITFRNCEFRGTAVEPQDRAEFLALQYNLRTRVEDCEFLDCGILVEEGQGDRFTRNGFTGDHGIRLLSSIGATVENNSMEATGIVIQGDTISASSPEFDWAYHNITSNSVGGSPILYHRNQTDLLLKEDAGQIFLVGCSNITVEGSQGTGSFFSLQLLDCQSGEVRNCSFMGAGSVFSMSHCQGLKVRNCSIRGQGLLLDYSQNCLVNQSYFSCPGNNAISFTGSDNNVITGCLLENSSSGVYLHDSHRNLLEGNSFSGNSNGVRITDSGNNSITRNDISESTQGLLLASGSWHNNISHNDIHHNFAGIYLSAKADYNIINFNNIYSSELFGFQVEWVQGKTPRARYNWWGHVSGPYHIDDNPAGYGDNVSWAASIKPWLTNPVKVRAGYDPEPEDKNTEEEGSGLVGSLLLFLALLLLVIVIVVSRLPEEHFDERRGGSIGRKGKAGKKKRMGEKGESSPRPLPPPPAPARTRERQPAEQPSSRTTASPPERINECPHCGGKFEVSSMKRPIHFLCHFCQKEVVLK